jgi:hypothetical protein
LRPADSGVAWQNALATGVIAGSAEARTVGHQRLRPVGTIARARRAALPSSSRPRRRNSTKPPAKNAWLQGSASDPETDLGQRRADFAGSPDGSASDGGVLARPRERLDRAPCAIVAGTPGTRSRSELRLTTPARLADRRSSAATATRSRAERQAHLAHRHCDRRHHDLARTLVFDRHDRRSRGRDARPPSRRSI